MDIRAFSFVKLEFKIGLFPCSHAHTRVFFPAGILTGILGYNVPRMGEKKYWKAFGWQALKERDRLENLGIDGE